MDSSPAPASASAASDWNLVLSDFRRSVSNLVLYILESVPSPWFVPSPPVPYQDLSADPPGGRDEGDGPRQPLFDLGNLNEEWFLSEQQPGPPLVPVPPFLPVAPAAPGCPQAKSTAAVPEPAPAKPPPNPKRVPKKRTGSVGRPAAVVTATPPSQPSAGLNELARHAVV